MLKPNGPTQKVLTLHCEAFRIPAGCLADDQDAPFSHHLMPTGENNSQRAESHFSARQTLSVNLREIVVFQARYPPLDERYKALCKGTLQVHTLHLGHH